MTREIVGQVIPGLDNARLWRPIAAADYLLIPDQYRNLREVDWFELQSCVQRRCGSGAILSAAGIGVIWHV